MRNLEAAGCDLERTVLSRLVKIMIPYLLLLFITTGFAHIGRRRGSLGVRRLTLLIVFVILVFFAGFRDQAIGTDTRNYVGWLSSINSFEDALAFPIEIGYGLLVLVSDWPVGGYAVLLLATAIITVAAYLTTFAKFTTRYDIALFVFISLGFYTFFFNGARQGIAASICFFALPFLLERKLIPYSLLVIVAALFHKSALAALPIYFVAASRFGVRELLFVAAGAVLMSAMLSAFTQLAGTFIDQKYFVYGQAGDGGGEVQVAFLIGQGLVLFLLKKQVDDVNGYYARLFNIYLIGLVPALSSVIGNVNPSGVLRLTGYFSHVVILLWPMVFLSFKNSQSRNAFFIGFLVVAVAYFTFTTMSFSDLMPYRINSELFH